jgi:hypothetical protein
MQKCRQLVLPKVSSATRSDRTPTGRKGSILVEDLSERPAMVRYFTPVLLLLAFTMTSSIAAPPYEADWIELLGDQGPVVIAKVGKNLSQCSDVELQLNSRELTAIPGVGVVAALAKFDYGDDNNLLSSQEFGDAEVYLEFLLGGGSNSGVKLQQRYEIQLFDSYGKKELSGTDCGGIYPHWKFRSGGEGLNYVDEGVAPSVNAAKPAGEWQTLHVKFRAPRFDDQGRKTANARFVSVKLNKQEIHRDLEVDSPTGNISSPLPEVPQAALFLQLDHGPVAFRNVRVKPLRNH